MSESERVRSGKIPCDFCGRFYNQLYPVNGGMWAACRECMEFEYGTIPRAYARQTPRPELPESPPLTIDKVMSVLAEYQEEEE